MKQSV